MAAPVRLSSSLWTEVPDVAKWIALALVGLLVAVGVAYAASRLASPKVALTSEPVSAGAKLAPPAARKPAPRRVPKHRRSRGNGTTSPAPPPAPTTTTTVP